MDESLQDRLWTDSITPSSYADTSDKYQIAIIEQYKMYVEMADRISGRRALANTFFLTLNTAIFTVIGVVLQNPGGAPAWPLAFPLIAILAQCAAWFYIVRSYRQLNSAKYEVIGAMEERLPASPYWRAEWFALGEGKDRSKYWPLTHLEQYIPVTFGGVYLFTFIMALIRYR